MTDINQKILFLDELTDRDRAIIQRESEKSSIAYQEADKNLPIEDQLDGVTAIVTRSTDIPASVIDGAKSLRYLMYEDFGTATIDDQAATSHNIPVIRLANLGWLGVCEHTILLMLSLVKQLPDAHFRTQAGERKPGVSEVKTTAREYTFSWLGQENLGWLYRKRLGLIGAGQIARGVAARAKAFGMQIQYYAPNQLSPSLEEQYDMTYRPLNELLEWADFVSVHAKLTSDNAKMLGANEFALMRPDAYFINTARGGLVDENALIDVLSNRRIAGAGLDVFEYEPTKRDNPLHKLDNVILTPHSAGIFNDDAREAQLIEAFDRVASGDTKNYIS